MANHVRRQIRDAVAAAVAGLTTTAARVFKSRKYPMTASQMPCLLVYTDEEAIDALTMGGMATRRLQRQVVVRVEGVAKSTESVEDTLEAIAAEVETAMMVDPTLAGLVKDLALVATDKGFSTQGDLPVGGIRLSYRATYHTLANTPDAAA